MKESVGSETLGKPKSHLWAAQQFCAFCINIEELDRRGGFFPRETCELPVVRGTTSFCNNKITNFCLLEKVLCGMFKCDEMNNVEGELFHFQLCFINYESVLTF